MPDSWASLADSASADVRGAISSSIRRAGNKLPWAPTPGAWTAYESSIAEELETKMLEAAESAASRAAWRLKSECEISSSVRKRIGRLAEKQAELIADNTRTAVSETKRKLKKLGLEDRQTRRVVRSVAGLNRQQAASVANTLKAKLGEGKLFGSALRTAEARGRKYARTRATRIAIAQSTSAAYMGIDVAMVCAEKAGAIQDPKRKWVKTASACSVCQRLHGKTVDAGKNFRHPDTGGALRGGDAHMSCNCGVEYVYEQAKREKAVA